MRPKVVVAPALLIFVSDAIRDQDKSSHSFKNEEDHLEAAFSTTSAAFRLKILLLD